MNRNDCRRRCFFFSSFLILINRRCFATHINDSFLRRTLMKGWAAKGVNGLFHRGSLNGYLVQLIIIITIIIYLVWLVRRRRWWETARRDRYTSSREHETFDILHGYTVSWRGRLNDADPFGNRKRFLFVQKTRLMRFCWLWNWRLI